jgi:hypothetical protein
MDIYRFFHPHHNPKLHNTAIRQQELGELEHAASELRKAIERAQQRSKRKASPPILPEHYNDIIKAAHFVEVSLRTLYNAHPGDQTEDLVQMIEERSSMFGWKNWAGLLKEQLGFYENEQKAE